MLTINIKLGFRMLLIFILNNLILEIQSQTTSNNCASFFKSVRRAGMNMAGRLEIPLDEQFPKFQLRLKFSRSIHHMTIRQLRAKDIGSHTEFIVDPMEQQSNGLLKLDTFLRLRNVFGPAPKLKGIVYNNRIICGDGIVDDSITITFPTSSTRRSIPILLPTSESPNQEKEYDEEVFE